MTSPVMAPDIGHLDHKPVCGSDRHQDVLPHAHWWLSGHGCGDALWCDSCVQYVRDMIATVGGSCVDCTREFRTANTFFGKMRPL